MAALHARSSTHSRGATRTNCLKEEWTRSRPGAGILRPPYYLWMAKQGAKTKGRACKLHRSITRLVLVKFFLLVCGSPQDDRSSA